jgi:DNA-binding NtrC family response regulator
VLIAEPGAAARDLLERQLAGAGFEVVQAGESRPALVLVGDSEALDAARSWDADVPVIVLGREQSEPADLLRAFEHGCDDYLERPFQYEELLGGFSHFPKKVISHFPGVFLPGCCPRACRCHPIEG